MVNKPQLIKFSMTRFYKMKCGWRFFLFATVKIQTSKFSPAEVNYNTSNAFAGQGRMNGIDICKSVTFLWTALSRPRQTEVLLIDIDFSAHFDC